MNAAQTAATFEIQTTPVLACDDPLCMSCAGDGVCAAARKPIHEIERESAAGEARLAEVEAEYDASRAAAPVPQDPYETQAVCFGWRWRWLLHHSPCR